MFRDSLCVIHAMLTLLRMIGTHLLPLEPWSCHSKEIYINMKWFQISIMIRYHMKISKIPTIFFVIQQIRPKLLSYNSEVFLNFHSAMLHHIKLTIANMQSVEPSHIELSNISKNMMDWLFILSSRKWINQTNFKAPRLDPICPGKIRKASGLPVIIPS